MEVRSYRAFHKHLIFDSQPIYSPIRPSFRILMIHKANEAVNKAKCNNNKYSNQSNDIISTSQSVINDNIVDLFLEGIQM